jgi:CheY-like chemotaxis protein
MVVVDDSEVDLRLAVATLERDGYSVVTAGNGREGLEKIKAVRPAAVVLDCEMPIMGGVELCRRLKSDEKLRGIPVIFVTSVDTPRNIVDCFDLKADMYLDKPLDANALLGAVGSALRRAEGAAPGATEDK